MLLTILTVFNTLAVCLCAVCLMRVYGRRGEGTPPYGDGERHALPEDEGAADDGFARDLAAIMGYTGEVRDNA